MFYGNIHTSKKSIVTRGLSSDNNAFFYALKSFCSVSPPFLTGLDINFLATTNILYFTKLVGCRTSTIIPN